MRRLIGLTAVAAALAGSLLSSGYVYIDRSNRLAEKAGQAVERYRVAATAAASAADEVTATAVLALAATEAGAATATIIDRSGAELAVVEHPELAGGWAAGLLPDVSVEVPLESEFERVGTLRLSLSRQPALATLAALLPGQALALILALGLAVLGTERMRATITRPIEGLLDTMQRVAREQDYALRAQPDGPEEIGSLINSFNEMLGYIRERDERLAEHRRQLQEQVIERTRNLEVAAKEAEHSSRAKGDFLARMSHEIRTPMNGVVGMAELLQNTQLDARQLRMLQTMRRSADALLEIINDILDFSKIEAGRLQVISDDFAVAELIEEVCELLASRAQERGLELVCDVDPGVPAFGNGDPIRLRQIVTNLLGNALKYTEEGHVIVRARVVNEDEHQFRLRVEVEDTGLGIPESEISAVFEAFTQVDSFETRKHGGTGLGLAITRQLVSLLGGEVGVVSRLKQGSTFWFELPLSHAVRPPRREPWAMVPMTTVLLVEPHGAAAAAIRSLLEAAGATVETVATGERAFEHLSMDESVGLVVADSTLPDMKGTDFLERLSASGRAAVPVVMLMPAAASGREPESGACEPDEWLVKPVSRTRLADAANRALGLEAPDGRRSTESSSSLVRSLGLKVLLVEDSPVNQEVACGMLEALGCEVVTAADGTLGVEYALGRSFDLVLMDCQMPLMDGYEATRKIRATEGSSGRRPVPIVAITANALPGDRERCLAAGMTDFISKPFTLRKLQAVMQAVTGVGGQVVPAADAATTGSQQTLPVIEVGQIEELRSLGRPQIVRQAILLFLKQAAQKLDELDAAVASAALVEVEQAAHSLKSASLSVGGRRFAGAAGDCEEAARSGDAEGVARHARRLRPEFRALCRALSSLAHAEEHAA